jgi:hypothetical protein
MSLVKICSTNYGPAKTIDVQYHVKLTILINALAFSM